MSEVTDALELSEVIAGLRGELEKAQKAGEGKAINFGVEGIEIELDVSVAKSFEGEGTGEIGMDADDMSLLKYVVGKVGAKFSIRGQGKYEKIATQKVKLTLSAQNKDGSDTMLSDEETS